MQIYLDYSATTPTRPEATLAIQNLLSRQWGNPSSLHEWGHRAALALEEARVQVASLVNGPPEGIIFTSGGTEADNLAIMGVARCYRQPQHLIISSVEHPAVSECALILELEGWQVTRLPVDVFGRVNPEDLEKAIQSNTVLVSIIYGQSEVGTIQSIESLGKISRDHGVLFHTDAVQVAGRLSLDVEKLPIDLLSLSSHKIYGPQGAGALYVRKSVELRPLLAGGGQESKLRSGTPGIPAIVGFGVAAALAVEEMATETPRLTAMRDRLFDLLDDVKILKPTGDRWERLPHHVSFSVINSDDHKLSNQQIITGRTLVRQLNLAGIGISAGSACHSGKLAPSPVLLAMGYDHIDATAGIRLTLGKQTSIPDIDWCALVIKQILARIMGG